METVAWLWLYDKRWMFGIRAPTVLKIWSVPIALNALFFGSLLYYTYEHENDKSCYTKFESWIQFRMALLLAILVCLVCIMLKASNKMQSERMKLGAFHKHGSDVSLKYTYWLRRRIIISVSGISLLLLGLINWIWTLYGMNQMYYEYYGVNSCGSYMQNVVWGNLILTGLFAFPVLWIMFWMITIKCLSLTLSVIWPSALIWIKKKAASA